MTFTQERHTPVFRKNMVACSASSNSVLQYISFPNGLVNHSSTLTIKRNSKELEIQLPSIEKQRVIGKAYFLLRKRQALAKKQAELEEKVYLEVLKKLGRG